MNNARRKTIARSLATLQDAHAKLQAALVLNEELVVGLGDDHVLDLVALHLVHLLH